MRIVVSAIGRAHCIDLAYGFQRQGLLTAVFTGYPRFKLRGIGLDPARVRSFPWLVAPYMGLIRWSWFSEHLDDLWSNWAHRTLDAHVARNLPDCDVVVTQCRIGVATGIAARRRGIVQVADAGTSHILVKERLMREEHERLGLPFTGFDRRAVDRELIEYEQADAISVPSGFARDSFLAQGIPPERLILAPYGVDLRFFHRSEPRAPEFRVLFVGQLGVRKGVHHLLRAFRKAALPNARLVLVGGCLPTDAELLRRFPAEPVEWLGRLPRQAVVREMSRASVLVLPSVEEGLAMVQAQAMACGCPVIASEHTGSRDLFTDGREGYILPVGDVEGIADRLRRLHADRGLLDAMSEAAIARARALDGWGGCAERLAQGIAGLMARRAGGPSAASRTRPEHA